MDLYMQLASVYFNNASNKLEVEVTYQTQNGHVGTFSGEITVGVLDTIATLNQKIMADCEQYVEITHSVTIGIGDRRWFASGYTNLA